MIAPPIPPDPITTAVVPRYCSVILVNIGLALCGLTKHSAMATIYALMNREGEAPAEPCAGSRLGRSLALPTLAPKFIYLSDRELKDAHRQPDRDRYLQNALGGKIQRENRPIPVSQEPVHRS